MFRDHYKWVAVHKNKGGAIPCLAIGAQIPPLIFELSFFCSNSSFNGGSNPAGLGL